MARKPSLPWKLLVSLLYNQYRWATYHPDGSCTLPVQPWLRALQTQHADLRRGLETLEGWGLLDRYHWGGSYVVLRAVVPPGMARAVTQNPQIVAQE